MKTVQEQFDAAKKLYDKGTPSFEECVKVVAACLGKIDSEATVSQYGDFKGRPNIHYWVAEYGTNISRPFRLDLVELDVKEFHKLAVAAGHELSKSENLDLNVIDRFIYSSVTSFCLVYDLWKPKSRKTPGTFFEVLMGSICRYRYPSFSLGKHVQIGHSEETTDIDEAIVDLEDTIEGMEELSVKGEFVSTDLVIHNEANNKGAIVPLKITTRERIVQPFAHQRILESAYPGRFKSFIACVSEVQRSEKKASVAQICVPGTIALFQRHLAEVSGLYYCDIPQRYSRQDMQKVIRVQNFSKIFSDIEQWLNS